MRRYHAQRTTRRRYLGLNIQLPRWVNIVSSCLEVRHSETMLAQERRIAATAFGLHNVHNTQRPPGCLSGAG